MLYGACQLWGNRTHLYREAHQYYLSLTASRDQSQTNPRVLPRSKHPIKQSIITFSTCRFLSELKSKEVDKDRTLDLAREILGKCHPDAVSVIKHWITIIQSRWDEVASWALQRRDKLEEHLKQLKDLLALLDELMQWLIGK